MGIALPLSAWAQRAPSRPAVRAELAAVLLQTGRYDEAVREYRLLLDRDPDSYEYRLGLARALAWSDHHRDAEIELRSLALRRPADAAVDTLLRTVRASLEPGVVEAESWFREHPDHAPYRRILAGALVRAGDTRRALAHYDTLIILAPTAEAYRGRAAAYVRAGDERSAERDLATSIDLAPSAGAYIELGDIYAARGNARSARAMYDAAATRASGNDVRRLAASRARLARDERPVLLAPRVGDDPGWRVGESAAADNLGVVYSELAARRTISLDEATTVGVTGLYRQLGQHRAGVNDDVFGVGARAGVATQLALGAYLVRAGLDGGAVQYGRGAGLVGEGGVSIAAWYDAWGAAVELASGPAFPSLLTVASLVPPDGTPALREQSVTATLGGPLGHADVAVSVTSAALSDANRRTSVHATARYPLMSHVFAVYDGGNTAFRERSDLYWDPDMAMSHGVGIEIASRQRRGWTGAARVVPAMVVTDEALHDDIPTIVNGELTYGRGPIYRRSALEFGGSGEAAYRADRWEIAGALSYGRGRAGTYQRFGISLGARWTP